MRPVYALTCDDGSFGGLCGGAYRVPCDGFADETCIAHCNWRPDGRRVRKDK
jgi:hypothetical protein